MKKVFTLFMAYCFIFLILMPSSPLFLKDEDSSSEITFILPGFLEIIEDEAFEGIAAESIAFPDSLLYIGERAFANDLYLKTVTIPESVEYIGEHAFDGSRDLTVYGSANSYAADWAREHDIMFVASENDLYYSKGLGKARTAELCILLSFICCDPDIILRLRKWAKNAGRSMRPQDRPELNPIDYRFP